MHDSVMKFVESCVSPEFVKNKVVLECGSYDVNGSVRHLFEGAYGYVGIDINSGPGVDVNLATEDAPEYFRDRTFDIVVSTEMLEHAERWREAVTAMKRMVTPGGALIITTRSEGFGPHNAPDYWRYSVGDFRGIFDDMHIEYLAPDPHVPGVFLRAHRPTSPKWQPKDLSNIHVTPIGAAV